MREGNLLFAGIIDTLYSQFGATLSAAARDDKATLVRGHADTESMGIAALDFFRLISSF